MTKPRTAVDFDEIRPFEDLIEKYKTSHRHMEGHEVARMIYLANQSNPTNAQEKVLFDARNYVSEQVGILRNYNQNVEAQQPMTQKAIDNASNAHHFLSDIRTKGGAYTTALSSHQKDGLSSTITNYDNSHKKPVLAAEPAPSPNKNIRPSRVQREKDVQELKNAVDKLYHLTHYASRISPFPFPKEKLSESDFKKAVLLKQTIDTLSSKDPGALSKSEHYTERKGLVAEAFHNIAFKHNIDKIEKATREKNPTKEASEPERPRFRR